MINSKLVTVKNPKSLISEDYRVLRTNIQFLSLDGKMKILVVTSTDEKEGRSTVASNLSVVLAQNGKKTILIDCDYRNPKIHNIFNVSNKYGICNILSEEVKFQEAVNSSEINNLDILTVGTKPENPSELLDSVEMKEFMKILKLEYDYIIIDTPPIIKVTDAQVLAQYADGCIFVVASRGSDREATVKAKLMLEKVNVKILGVVLNKMEISNRGAKNTYYDVSRKEQDKLINRIFSRLKISKLKQILFIKNKK